MKEYFYKKTKKKGAVYLFVVFIMTVTTVAIAIGFTTPNIREFSNALRENKSNAAFLYAEAGNEDVFYRLKNSLNVPTSPSNITITFNDGNTAVTTVTTNGDDRTIETESSVDNHTRKSKLEMSSVSATTNVSYAAHAGAWGVKAHSNADVTGVFPAVGEIYANGPIRAVGSNVVVTGNVYSATSMTQDISVEPGVCVDQHVGDSSPVLDVAQSFIAPTITEALTRVDLYIKEVNGPNSRNLRLFNDDGSGTAPNVAAELTYGLIDRNKVNSNYGWVSIILNTPQILTPGSTYWVVFDAQNQGSKYWVWCKDQTNSYTDGNTIYTNNYTSPSWVSITEDLAFQTYFGDGESKIKDIDDIQGDAHADLIDGSTITGGAYYQSILGSTAGSYNSGQSTPATLPLPLTDTQINSWKSAAEVGTVVSGNCPGTSGCPPDSGTSGNMKIDGDFHLENLGTSSGDEFVINGTLYVTGDFSTDNNVILECDSSYGANSCVIVADGTMAFSNNTQFRGSGTSGSFIILVTTKSGCLDTVGTDCLTMQGSGSEKVAMHHENNGVTGGVFFALYSLIGIENNAKVSSVVAEGIILDNNAELVYDNDLQNLNISSGGGGGWLVNDWREIE